MTEETSHQCTRCLMWVFKPHSPERCNEERVGVIRPSFIAKHHPTWFRA